MTGEQIKRYIDYNNTQIENILDPSIHTLNSEIIKLLELNDELRTKCPHEDDGFGFCKYCQEEIIGE